MIRQLPTDDQVRLAMAQVMAEAAENGRRPTVSAVEVRLDVTHATFYRNYPELIEEFKAQIAEHRESKKPANAEPGASPEEVVARLRRENEDYRKLVKIYAESIRQLSVDNTRLREAAESRAGVADLSERRERRAATEPIGPC